MADFQNRYEKYHCRITAYANYEDIKRQTQQIMMMNTSQYPKHLSAHKPWSVTKS